MDADSQTNESSPDQDGWTLEVCAFSLASCLIAEQCGAQRVELCDNPAEGGTTAGYGMLKSVREKVSLQLYPIIRPRGGDFLYDENEFDIMKKDVLFCRELGCDGVVIGILNADGTIDKTRSRRLVELAYPMGVTFHRAFDRAGEPFQAMEDIIETGCERILTSGQVPNALDGSPLIKQLIERAAERIIIMPGSGIRSANIMEIVKQTGAVEFHTSARINIKSQMQFINPNMNEELNSVMTDGKELSNIITILKNAYLQLST